MNKEPEVKNKASLLFDWLTEQGHPWDDALNELDSTTDVGKRILSRNCRMDHRVSVERGKSLVDKSGINISGNDIRGEDLLNYWRDYYQNNLCRFSTSSVNNNKNSELFDNNNRNNLIKNRTPGFDQLIHVASLNSILKRLVSSFYGNSITFKRKFLKTTNCSFPVVPTDITGNRADFNEFVNSIAGNLEEQDTETIKNMAGLFCENLGNR